MRKGPITLLIVTVVCLISIAIFTFNFYKENEYDGKEGYFNIHYTPDNPVEFEDVLVYVDITYPDEFLAYLVYFDGKGTSTVLMLKINDTSYLGQMNAEEAGRDYEFWIIIIDDNTTIEQPLLSSKHLSYTVSENTYPPILSDIKRSPLHPTENDTISFKATMRNARHIRYDVILDYNVLYTSGTTNNRSVDMVRIKEGIVFSCTIDPEPVNSTITYSVAVWYKFKSLVITSSQDYMFMIID